VIDFFVRWKRAKATSAWLSNVDASNFDGISPSIKSNLRQIHALSVCEAHGTVLRPRFRLKIRPDFVLD
jgi:hypothetical protein